MLAYNLSAPKCPSESCVSWNRSSQRFPNRGMTKQFSKYHRSLTLWMSGMLPVTSSSLRQKSSCLYPSQTSFRKVSSTLMVRTALQALGCFSQQSQCKGGSATSTSSSGSSGVSAGRQDSASATVLSSPRM